MRIGILYYIATLSTIISDSSDIRTTSITVVFYVVLNTYRFEGAYTKPYTQYTDPTIILQIVCGFFFFYSRFPNCLPFTMF